MQDGGRGSDDDEDADGKVVMIGRMTEEDGRADELCRTCRLSLIPCTRDQAMYAHFSPSSQIRCKCPATPSLLIESRERRGTDSLAHLTYTRLAIA